MGITNQIQELNFLLRHLRGLKCAMCQQLFTEKELQDGNFELWFSTHSDVEWKEQGRSGEHWINILVRKLSHKQIIAENPSTEQKMKIFACPQTELCQKCDDRFLTKTITKFKRSSYCPPCYQKITKED